MMEELVSPCVTMDHRNDSWAMIHKFDGETGMSVSNSKEMSEPSLSSADVESTTYGDQNPDDLQVDGSGQQILWHELEWTARWAVGGNPFVRAKGGRKERRKQLAKNRYKIFQETDVSLLIDHDMDVQQAIQVLKVTFPSCCLSARRCTSESLTTEGEKNVWRKS